MSIIKELELLFSCSNSNACIIGIRQYNNLLLSDDERVFDISDEDILIPELYCYFKINNKYKYVFVRKNTNGVFLAKYNKNKPLAIIKSN